MLKKALLLLSIAVMLVLPVSALAAPASQTGSSYTFTKTEAELNSLYRVTNPARTSVTNKFVDIQEGQVVVGATFTPRNGTPYNVAVTYVPRLQASGSRTIVVWDITAFTVNGQPSTGDGDYISYRNAITNGWRRALLDRASSRYTAQSITLSADTLTIVYVRN